MHAAPFQIDPAGGRFSFDDARRACDFALCHNEGSLVIIDLTRAVDATTSAFAQLVVLRRELLRSGRDLRLCGLRERAAHVHSVNRLGGVLPVQ